MSKDSYTKDDITKMLLRLDEVQNQYDNLQNNIFLRKFESTKGSEFAKHGFLRRCDIMLHCIKKTFESLPPDLEGLPNNESVDNATIFLHCFIINVFGACDNLAWIIVYEQNITKSDGSPIDPKSVGLRKGNRLVRGRLSAKMIENLDRFEPWFHHVDMFRHSLAHRISLYVPPYIVPTDRAEEYYRLDAQRRQARLDRNFSEAERIKRKLDEIKFFRPWITHSYSEDSPIAVIHPQMLADFGAVLELGEATFREI